MFRNYLKTAWRSLLNNRLSSFINIGGLAIGMAVAMLITCWIYYEWSYDRQFERYDRIAQVWEVWTGGKNCQRQLPAVVADELRAKYASNFEHIFKSSMTREHVFGFGDKKLIKLGNFIEPEGLEVLRIPMRQGGSGALKDPHSIMLSESLAKTIFADADPVGQVLHMDDTVALRVTAVYKDFPYNSSFRDITFLAPWDLYASIDPETRFNGRSWEDNNWQTFVQLNENGDIDKISAKIKDVKANNDPIMDSTGQNRNKTALFLHPMSRWHLYSEFKDGDKNTGRIKFVQLFGLIGVLVLLLACINFMDLSTARSEKRAKEVGIRKAIGSRRVHLIAQFFGESMLVSCLALVIALGLVFLSMPFFNGLADAQMTVPWMHMYWWLACIGFSLFTGLIAGSYPAFYLSSFRPVKVLKGVFRVGRFASLPRKVLVVVQFTVSIAMIIGTVIVFRQVQYAKERPVGYDRGGLLMTQTHTGAVHEHFAAFRNDLLSTGAVVEAAESIAPVTESWPFNGGLTWTGHLHPGMGDGDFSMKGITEGYGKTVGLQFTQGRDFRSGPSGSDSGTMIINETAVKNMGLKEPIGKTITWMGYNFKIIGVVKDVIMESPYESPFPALYYLAPFQMASVTMKLNPRMSAQEALRLINPVFTRFDPSEPFDYKFVDAEYDAKFRDDLRIGQLAGFFTILAIFISCLGLFGRATFIAEQRIREIGIRKVLGATVFSLWKLLSRDFLVLVGLSYLIAIPIAWIFLAGWLEQYAYRTSISWWIFGLAGLSALVIALVTVSFQALRAANRNPVKSLRVSG